MSDGRLNLDDVFGGRQQCRHRNVGPAHRYASDGHDQVISEWCYDCDQPTDPRSLAKEELVRRGIDIRTLPTKIDLRTEGELCAVEGCGSRATQLHHWAPQTLEDWFGEEWAKWPTSWLCREKHHPLWHRVVTPELTSPKTVGEVMRNARLGTPLRELMDAARSVALRQSKKGEAA